MILGTLGGIGLVVGPSGLLYLNLKRHPLHGDREQKPVDRGFIFLLLIVSVSGLALMAFRNTPYMALLLIVQLATVMTFFITMPFGLRDYLLNGGLWVRGYFENQTTSSTVSGPFFGRFDGCYRNVLIDWANLKVI